MPGYVKWVMTFIERVGFPILVCIWLGYQQFISDKQIVKALQDFKEVMTKMTNTIEQQNRILRHKQQD